MDKWLQPALAALVLAVALLVRWFDPAILGDLRALVFDQYQRVAPRTYQPLPVKIVDIDDASIAKFGQWPWPRSVIAKLVAKLRAQGAAVIAFDVVFSEPDRTAPVRVYTNWDIAPDDPLVRELQERVTDPDAKLAAELARGNIVLGFVLTEDDKPAQIQRKGGMVPYGINPRNLVQYFPGVLPALPQLQDAAKGNGAVNAVPDRDAIVRRVPMLLNGAGDLDPSLVAETLRVSLGISSYLIKST